MGLLGGMIQMGLSLHIKGYSGNIYGHIDSYDRKRGWWTSWVIILASHLGRYGHGEAVMRQLAQVLKDDSWCASDKPFERLNHYVPVLRDAGATPWERAAFLAEAWKGLQVSELVGEKHDWSRWEDEIVPFPALHLAGTNGGIAKQIERDLDRILGNHAALRDPDGPLVATKAGDKPILSRRKDKEAVAQRRAFLGRFRDRLEALGAHCGMSHTGSSDWRDKAIRDSGDGSPLSTVQIDALWVYQYLLDDPDALVGREAFKGLLRVRYGGEDSGLEALKGGGEGAYPFGIERVLLEHMSLA